MNSPLQNKKVLFLLAPHLFRDEEYFQSKVILQARGADIHTAAAGDPEEITGTRGGKARTDTLFDTINAKDFDALVLIGGKGSKVYFDDSKIHRLVTEFVKADKLVAAICSAVGILARAQVIDGVKVVGFEEEEKAATDAGATWEDKPVVVDNKIITAKNHEAAIAFGEAIAKELTA